MLRVEEVPLGDRRLKALVDFPWRLHSRDPCWTPPLRAELLGGPVLGTLGLLTARHPYHRHADVTHFLAVRGREVVGTVSAAINHRFDEYHGSHMGFFGFFETVDDESVASSLLDAAREWVASRGADTLRGPGQYSNATHERQGVLVEGFEYPPTVELTHNPPYYDALLQRYGMSKAMDYLAYMVRREDLPLDRIQRLSDGVRARHTITTRPADMRRFREELQLVVRIYNEAWERNWGFLPLSEAEADVLAESLRPIVDPGLIRFAYSGDRPIAVLGALPDPYWALRPRWRFYGDSDVIRLARLAVARRRIPRMRAMFFGVLPEFRRIGVDALLFGEVISYGLGRGFYEECEASMVLENNKLMRRVAEAVGGHAYKRWRIYECSV